MARIIFLFCLSILLSGSLYAQSWNQIIKATASDMAEQDEFGSAVSISGDYAIVGAHLEDEDENGNNTKSKAGSAYIFKRNGNNWTQIKKLVASDRNNDDEFGFSVAISGDYAIIGAPYEDEDVSGNNNKPNAGSAYILKRIKVDQIIGVN